MSNFTFAIKTSILFFPFVALFFTFFYLIYQYHKYGSINCFRTIIIYSFILYIISAYFLVILPLPSLEYAKTISMPAYNLKPFNFVLEIIKNTNLSFSDFTTYFPTLKYASTYEAIFNIFLTIPFGVYLHYYFKCSFKKTLFCTFCLTLFFELTQLSGLYFIYPRSYRVFDVDDLILNTFGGFLGYFLGSLFNKFLPTREKIDKDSYQKGESVSLLKRLCALSIDFINIILLVFLESYFVYKKYISIIWLILPFLGYFLIILIFKKSLGMKYLNLKFQHFLDTKVKTFNIIIYYFSFLFGYIILPILLILGSYLLFSHHYLTLNQFEYFLVIILAISIMIDIISLWLKVFQQDLFYEKLSKIKIISTINEQP